MFDPEKVERHEVREGSDGWPIGERCPETVVLASDYDKLLKLYLDARLAAESWADAVQYPEG